jgi:HEAT repeat protein
MTTPVDDVPGLLLRALAGDDDARWEVVVALQRRPTPEVFSAMAALCASPEAPRRLLGVDVLGQLGVDARPFREEALPLLLAALDDPDPTVAAAAGIALGHHQDPRAIGALRAHLAHPSAEVRAGIVHGFVGLEAPEAVAALVTLSQDVDPGVRDWAVFGLGCLADPSRDARDALLARVDDPDPDVKAEARAAVAAWTRAPLSRPLGEA